MRVTKNMFKQRMLPISIGLSLLTASVGSMANTPAQHIDAYSGLPRVFVLTDMGNEPDDQMSMVRLLTYSNELDLEGLIAVTSTWQRAKRETNTIKDIIEANPTCDGHYSI